MVEAPAAQPAPAPAPVVQAPAPQREDLVRYTIVAGDTTSTIADRHGSTVAELVAINGLPAGGALIFAGDTMLVPGAAKADVSRTVTIAPGDTLAELARTHGTTVDALVEANGIADPDLIVAGGSLTVR